MKTVGCVISQRVVGNRAAELEERYYISSRKLTAKELAKTVRAHWAIENRLHWMLDVCFSEDGCMIRKDNAPQNLSLLKKIVVNLIRADKTDTANPSRLDHFHDEPEGHGHCSERVRQSTRTACRTGTAAHPGQAYDRRPRR